MTIDKYSGPERRMHYGWHIRREISVSHIITTILILIGALKFGYDIDKRVAILEDAAVRRDSTILEVKALVNQSNNKLDELINMLIRGEFDRTERHKGP